MNWKLTRCAPSCSILESTRKAEPGGKVITFWRYPSSASMICRQLSVRVCVHSRASAFLGSGGV